MPDYSKSKLYFIRTHQTDLVYVGSTVQSLSERMRGHRKDYKMYLDGEHHYITSFEILKYDDAYIELVKECPCENIEQLTKIEGEFIRNTDCVNKRIEGRTKKEYIEDNKQKIQLKKAQYYEKNKDEIQLKSKEYRLKNKDKIQEYQKEYRQDNKVTSQEYQQQWYKNNKSTIETDRKTIVECECGSKVQKNVLYKHKKTDKHKSLLALLVLNG